MAKLFGTDGIRGIANKDLTINMALNIGAASAYILGKGCSITVIVGRDTRKSGEMLSSALIAGLLSYGAKVIDLGIIPTPAISFYINKYNADLGAMISASHNPSEYNGIKLFNDEGYKLSDEYLDKIEPYILDQKLPDPGVVGNYVNAQEEKTAYIDFLFNTAKKINTNIKPIVDCANGSASVTAPLLFARLGLKARFINTDYDGTNINLNCGSTHMDSLINEVQQSDADIGIAFDGDADRCLLTDNEGNIVDGDYIMAISSLFYKQHNKLKNNSIVGTVMTNLGLRKFCEENDINFISTSVGDRFILEEMIKNDYMIGGEQSGHIIFRDHFNTGDGELTAIIILNILSSLNRPLSELSSIMQKYPQVLINIEVSLEGKNIYDKDPEIASLIKNTENELGNDGRILVRPSGTENLIRVMIEGFDRFDINQKANQIATLIKNKYGI